MELLFYVFPYISLLFSPSHTVLDFFAFQETCRRLKLFLIFKEVYPNCETLRSFEYFHFLVKYNFRVFSKSFHSKPVKISLS